jgi:sphingomyelin phosphodiesterase
MLDFVKTSIKPDILFWTGDNSPHDIWESSNQDVTLSTYNLTTIMQRAFEGTNISIYATLGNHDTWPVNIQSFDAPNSNI